MSDMILVLIFLAAGIIMVPAGFFLLAKLQPADRPPGVQFSEPPLRFLAVLFAYGLMLFGVVSVGVGIYITTLIKT